ncbi:MAG: NAD(P)-dependent oxidoreductase [Steroidobacteraceae bacterium]
MATLGWIGAGEIGMPMAQRLLRAGHVLHVWGRDARRLQPLLDAGAYRAASPAALGRDCEAVLLCVTDTEAVRQVVFGEQGIATVPGHDKILIDHSTIHPQSCRDMAATLRATCGREWLDAPVSGGPAGATQGRLAIFVGGDAAAFARTCPWMQSYAETITHVGGSGAGQILKSCNQAVVATTIAAWAEALNYAKNCEVDVAQLVAALAGSWSDSPVLRQLVPHMLRNAYPPGAAALMLKDLDIVGDMAKQTRSPMLLASTAASLLRLQIALGENDAGPPGLMRIYRKDPLL